MSRAFKFNFGYVHGIIRRQVAGAKCMGRLLLDILLPRAERTYHLQESAIETSYKFHGIIIC